ncbi:hypothetical protein [Streptomyces asoensis]|uniref:hypothetical protein n=1 Tax=Streptomyces asoensis TaxID=249586 RepID=UPI0033EE50B3
MLGIVVLILVRAAPYASDRPTLARIFLASTGAAPTITSALAAVTGWISSISTRPCREHRRPRHPPSAHPGNAMPPAHPAVVQTAPTTAALTPPKALSLEERLTLINTEMTARLDETAVAYEVTESLSKPPTVRVHTGPHRSVRIWGSKQTKPYWLATCAT